MCKQEKYGYLIAESQYKCTGIFSFQHLFFKRVRLIGPRDLFDQGTNNTY